MATASYQFTWPESTMMYQWSLYSCTLPTPEQMPVGALVGMLEVGTNVTVGDTVGEEVGGDVGRGEAVGSKEQSNSIT
jgi:hypothetical protein